MSEQSHRRFLPASPWLSLVPLLIGLMVVVGTGPQLARGENVAILPVFAVVVGVIAILVGLAGLLRSRRHSH